MKAVIYRSTGAADDVLEVVELPVPEPGPGQVRVAITASAINPTDWKQRAGITRGEPEGFQVPHHDGVGRIDAIGTDVRGLAVGQRVWLYLAAADNRYGTAAQYAVVPADRAVPLPDHASDELGACLGVPALTAAHCLGSGSEALRGKTVLVAGGAGAVGHYAIELAKYAGARVVTTVSSTAKAELARAAGADIVVDYTTGDVADRILNSVGRVDRIIEVALAANIGLDVAVAADNAEIAVYAVEADDPRLPVAPLATANVTIKFVLLYTISEVDRAAAISWTCAAVEAGALTALPITEYGLDDAAAAQSAVEAGAVGKVVLRP
ncbi:MAG: NADPH:quinone reductase [Mycobacterium sp.]